MTSRYIHTADAVLLAAADAVADRMLGTDGRGKDRSASDPATG